MTRSVFRARFMRLMFFLSLIFFAFGLLYFTKETSAAAVEGLNLCARVLIPSLFPFMVVSSVAISSGLAQKAGRLFQKPMQFLFGVPGVCAPAFVLGLIGGYPVGAANAIMLYKANMCTKTQAERLLAFCNNCGPAFILGVVGVSLFGCTAAGLLLYGAHISASLVIGLIFRFYKRDKNKTENRNMQNPISQKELSCSALFTSSVKNSVPSVLNVCAYVIFFSVAVQLLYLAGIIPAAARLLAALLRPMDLPISFTEKIISGIFELTGGVYGIASSGEMLGTRLTAAAFMLGWAGFSVHFQVLDFMCDSGLSPKPYVIGKLLHGILSAVFVYIGAFFIPFDTQVSKTVAGHISALYSSSAFVIFVSALICCIGVWGVLWLLSRIFIRK